MNSNLLTHFKSTDHLIQRINELYRDLDTLRYSKEQLKDKYKDIFNASSHLFDVILSKKMDKKVMNMMIESLRKFEKNPDKLDEISRDTGKKLADEYLYPKIGKQPAMSKAQEDLLINKVHEENKKEQEKIDKVNAGEIDASELTKNSRKMDFQ